MKGYPETGVHKVPGIYPNLNVDIQLTVKVTNFVRYNTVKFGRYSIT